MVLVNDCCCFVVVFYTGEHVAVLEDVPGKYTHTEKLGNHC